MAGSTLFPENQSMFKPGDDETVEFLEEWVLTGQLREATGKRLSREYANYARWAHQRILDAPIWRNSRIRG